MVDNNFHTITIAQSKKQEPAGTLWSKRKPTSLVFQHIPRPWSSQVVMYNTVGFPGIPLVAQVVEGRAHFRTMTVVTGGLLRSTTAPTSRVGQVPLAFCPFLLWLCMLRILCFRILTRL